MGTGNLGVRLSPESGQLSENFVFTFSTEDGMGPNSAVGEYIVVIKIIFIALISVKLIISLW